MIGGFALVAWPAEYGVTGVHTFIVNQDATVYEKDLGSQTPTRAPALVRYDPTVPGVRGLTNGQAKMSLTRARPHPSAGNHVPACDRSVFVVDSQDVQHRRMQVVNFN